MRLSSEQVGDLMIALAKAQGQFPAIKKDSNNYYGGKYAQLDAIVDAVRPSLSANGIALYHIVESDLERRTASVCTYLQHGEQWIADYAEVSAVSYAWDKESREMKERFDAQTISAAWTNFKRTTLQAVTGVAAEEDEDAQPLVGNNPPQQRATPAQVSHPISDVRASAQKRADEIAVAVKNPERADDLVKCFVKGITEKETKGKKPYLSVTWRGMLEGFSYASCFHKSLFEALKDAVGNEAELRISEKKSEDGKSVLYFHVDDVLSVNGRAYKEGKPNELITKLMEMEEPSADPIPS